MDFRKILQVAVKKQIDVRRATTHYNVKKEE